MSKFAKIYGLTALAFIGLFVGSMFINIPGNPVATLTIRFVGAFLFLLAALEILIQALHLMTLIN